jgi:hypothetical protein
MAEDRETTTSDSGEKMARRIRWAMWSAAAVLVVFVAWMALRSIYDRQVSDSKTKTCAEYGRIC